MLSFERTSYFSLKTPRKLLLFEEILHCVKQCLLTTKVLSNTLLSVVNILNANFFYKEDPLLDNNYLFKRP